MLSQHGVIWGRLGSNGVETGGRGAHRLREQAEGQRIAVIAVIAPNRKPREDSSSTSNSGADPSTLSLGRPLASRFGMAVRETV